MAILEDLLDVQRKSNQQLCANFNEACREMVYALKVTHQEKKKRQTMRRELDELKEDFVKLKGMVHLAVANVNLQNNGFLTEYIVDVFKCQTLGARAYGNRCLHVGNISGFGRKFFQCSYQIHFIYISNVTSTFAFNVIADNISFTFQM